jgi:hypothetical protein
MIYLLFETPQQGLLESILDAEVCWSRGVYEIPNSKHQITNKSQIPISNDQNRFGILNFGHCYLFDICDLGFGISIPPVLQNMPRAAIALSSPSIPPWSIRPCL